MRCLNKTIRHFYHTYTAMGYKFRVYAIDWARMSSFYILYPTEYCLSIVIVLATLPIVKSNKSLNLMERFGISFDFAIFYFLYMCLSLPHFLNTCVYLHRKRLQQLYIARQKAEEDADHDTGDQDEPDSPLFPTTPSPARATRRKLGA